MQRAHVELEQFGKQDNFFPNHVITVTWHKAEKKNNAGTVSFYTLIFRFLIFLFLFLMLSYLFVN